MRLYRQLVRVGPIPIDGVFLPEGESGALLTKKGDELSLDVQLSWFAVLL